MLCCVYRSRSTRVHFCKYAIINLIAMKSSKLTSICTFVTCSLLLMTDSCTWGVHYTAYKVPLDNRFYLNEDKVMNVYLYTDLLSTHICNLKKQQVRVSFIHSAHQRTIPTVLIYIQLEKELLQLPVCRIIEFHTDESFIVVNCTDG